MEIDEFNDRFDRANKHNEIIYKRMMREMFDLDMDCFGEDTSVLQLLSFIHAEHHNMLGELTQLRKFYADFKERVS